MASVAEVGPRDDQGPRHRWMGRWMGSAAFAALALGGAGAAAELEAQVCAGGVTQEGEYAVRGDLNVANSTTDYGGGVEANLPGPLAVQAGVSFTEERRAFNGQLTYDLTDGTVAVCPMVRGDFRTMTREEDHGEVDHSRLRLPVGITVGSRVALSDGASLVPSVEGGIFYDRVSEEGAPDGDWSATDTAFFTRAGVTLGLGDTFFRGSAGVDTQGDKTDVDFRLSAGVRF